MFDQDAYAKARSHSGVTLLFIRHGQTEWNASGRHLGWSDIGLDALGRQQAEGVARALDGRFDRIYSSPLSRAWQTACAMHAQPAADPDLRELDQGDLDGLDHRTAFGRWPDFYASFAEDPTDVTPPGSSETLGGCRDRFLRALDRMVAGARTGEILAVVSHQMAMASALCTMEGSPLRDWRNHRLPNCGIRVVQTHGSTYRIS